MKFQGLVKDRIARRPSRLDMLAKYLYCLVEKNHEFHQSTQ
jgi:hypothetical protein